MNEKDKMFHLQHDGEEWDTYIPVCPHCYKDCSSTVEEGNYKLGDNETECEHCKKKFWYEADVRFFSRRNP